MRRPQASASAPYHSDMKAQAAKNSEIVCCACQLLTCRSSRSEGRAGITMSEQMELSRPITASSAVNAAGESVFTGVVRGRSDHLVDQVFALLPLAEAGRRVDVADRADIEEAAAPVAGEAFGTREAAQRVVGRSGDDGREG